ncbi:GNAT superfamily N-acetyltransferase [Allocatelliglobosispora scoriae]|uniref:GNAT superfamily N-acetyltransferase n=1 Tax=Allocatelliglobosispora scoriae TaxID=643052 RepID=A0A841BY73_9ACTN|nr:DUF3626 domain-containing protein [Allocatelliglobosispora scoriae]MBB5872615.1 GNAT superfamily N-acetyltransferase [Allocatelliglobosispora scoriae]
MPPVLTAAQLAALDHVRRSADARRAEALARIGEVCDLEELIAGVRAHGRVTLNFHPDRHVTGGLTVAESMARDGRYRSQFETGHSNGGLTAFPGGDRDRWEERIFGGAYHRGAFTPAERPVYGGLNLADHADGASPRFGSCHVRLRPAVLERCTFSFGDSHLDPPDWGTIGSFHGVLAGLVESGTALGLAGTDGFALLRGLPGTSRGVGRSLDDYIEAQVHGVVDLAADAEALVLDPSFRGTGTGELLAAIARDAGIGVEWHAGFQLTAPEVPAGFRGSAIPPLAAIVAAEFGAGFIDAETVGRAAATLRDDPARWTRTGTPPEVRQYLKQLWHTLVHLGRPSPPPHPQNSR